MWCDQESHGVQTTCKTSKNKKTKNIIISCQGQEVSQNLRHILLMQG